MLGITGMDGRATLGRFGQSWAGEARPTWLGVVGASANHLGRVAQLVGKAPNYVGPHGSAQVPENYSHVGRIWKVFGIAGGKRLWARRPTTTATLGRAGLGRGRSEMDRSMAHMVRHRGHSGETLGPCGLDGSPLWAIRRTMWATLGGIGVAGHCREGRVWRALAGRRTAHMVL